MCCMCLLVGSPKISVHMIGIGGWFRLNSCWVHTQVPRNCFVVVWLLGTKHGQIIRLAFSSMCNWLDYRNSFSGIQTDCLWQTVCILERQLLVSITQNHHSSYLKSSSRNSGESCHWGVKRISTYSGGGRLITSLVHRDVTRAPVYPLAPDYQPSICKRTMSLIDLVAVTATAGHSKTQPLYTHGLWPCISYVVQSIDIKTLLCFFYSCHNFYIFLFFQHLIL